MKDLKPGDKVKCINAIGSRLIQNNIYTFDKYFGGGNRGVCLEEFDNNYAFLIERFEKVNNKRKVG